MLHTKPMRICIPTIEEKGLDSRVSEHFGRAPFHLVVNTETMEVVPLRRERECDDSGHGHCLPVRFLLAHGVDLVICREIGRGAFSRLGASNIDVFEAGADTVGAVIEHYSRNKNAMLRPQLCSGHGHHHH